MILKMKTSTSREFYNACADIYDKRHNTAVVEKVRAAERSAIEKYASGRLLDVGCGTGAHMRYADVGVDISEKMLAKARPKTKKPLIVADGAALPFASGSFDACICMFAVLNACPAAAAEMKRVLKRDGFAIVSVASHLEHTKIRHEGRTLGLKLFSRRSLCSIFKGMKLVDFSAIFAAKPLWKGNPDARTSEKERNDGYIYLAIFQKKA